MEIVNANSLAETLDVINESFFHGQAPTVSERKEAAKWIATLQGKPGSYFGMFAPTDADLRNRVRVFTGEVVRSKVATKHVLGEEACRALILLNVPDTGVKDALARATRNMLIRLRETENRNEVHGFYCCGTCSTSYWRNVAVGGLDRNDERLAEGMKILKSLRIGDGRWRRFPLYSTLLALSEINIKSATEEIRYAAPVLEHYLKQATREDKYSERRRILFERILARY
jgi:hypothetical protein